MKKVYFVLWCLMFCQFTIIGQTKRYLYIHNTNNQQFNLRIGHQIYTSDNAGNLIIPQLSEGALHFSIILHQQPNYMPSFQVALDDRNQGWNLLLSNGSAVLENWNTKEQLKPDDDYKTDNWWNGTKKKDNHFAQMMADLVADSAVLYTTNKIVPSAKPTDIAKTDPRLTSGTIPSEETNKDTLSQVEALTAEEEQEPVNISVAIEDTVRTDTVALQLPQTKPDTIAAVARIELKNDTVTSTGRQMIYAIRNGENEEQIDVFIPVEAEKEVKKTVQPDTTAAVISKPEEKKPVEMIPDTATIAPVQKETASKELFIMYNSDCKGVTTDTEIDKYRVRLMSLNQEQRFAQVQRYLKAKCFTTRQIKALSELFPTDDDKYRFFELAYPYVEETTTFKELIGLLESDLNRTKFKQMTRMQ